MPEYIQYTRDSLVTSSSVEDVITPLAYCYVIVVVIVIALSMFHISYILTSHIKPIIYILLHL